MLLRIATGSIIVWLKLGLALMVCYGYNVKVPDSLVAVWIVFGFLLPIAWIVTAALEDQDG